MILPELLKLREEESTYITFQKSLHDFDKAVHGKKEWFFSKMVALELPFWQKTEDNKNFFLDLNSVGVTSTDPNIVFPKAIQYYMENICRHNIALDRESIIDEITELAFWKTLEKMGLDETRRKNMVTFMNGIYTSNFIEVENNVGWCEVVTVVPNKCALLKPAWRTVDNVANIIQSNETDTCLFDNGNKQFIFDQKTKQVLDFEKSTWDEITEQEFNFNVLLLYYKDETGKDKLHGINFIYPFENKVTYWDLETLTQKTNRARTIGYQFLFNMKSCNNQASKLAVYEEQKGSFYNNFEKTLSLMSSFLETKIND